MQKIELEWCGGITWGEALTKFNDRDVDYGLYAIYGADNNLLYVGKAARQNISQRLFAHVSWVESLPSDVVVYIGRLGGYNGTPYDDAWEREIDLAEKLIINHVWPQGNSSNINSVNLPKGEEILVLNHGKRNKLPGAIHTDMSLLRCQRDDNGWQFYNIINQKND
jgi:hypothetical protein